MATGSKQAGRRVSGRCPVAALALLVCLPALSAGQRRLRTTADDPFLFASESRNVGSIQLAAASQASTSAERLLSCAAQPGQPPTAAWRGPATPPAPASHLGAWLNEHRNLTPPEQERLLRSDPSFRQLPPIEQQRLLDQLHQVYQLTPEQQRRRMARAEALTRLSPQERLQISLSARRWAALPPPRQMLLKTAFHDLRAVPIEQRQMVLNSRRYQGVFSPDERAILSDMLRIEPYTPAP